MGSYQSLEWRIVNRYCAIECGVRRSRDTSLVVVCSLIFATDALRKCNEKDTGGMTARQLRSVTFGVQVSLA